ncbi:MAG: histidine phosphatase family protein [Fuerstia sp.]|nr:histidine phosphatase family protein [Fuerstiella sp.]
MRHAQAATEEAGESDFERRLTADGIRMATQTATTLRNRGFHIDRLIASAAERTRQTADLVTEEMQLSGARVDLDELYLAPAKMFEAALCERTFEDESSVLVVGHNPGIASLICRWADKSLAIHPATVAVFESPADTWLHVRRTKVHVPELVCLLQDGKIAWHRDETTRDPQMLE